MTQDTHNTAITQIQQIFMSRLNNLKHFLEVAEAHFEAAPEALFELRLAPDMFPFGTQIAFTCNQPYHFALWCLGQETQYMDKEVTGFAAVRAQITQTQELLQQIDVSDEKLTEIKRVALGPELFIEVPGQSYVDDFLMPNFYFHLTTAYAILRAQGVTLGKGDYMRHLAPLLQHVEA